MRILAVTWCPKFHRSGQSGDCIRNHLFTDFISEEGEEEGGRGTSGAKAPLLGTGRMQRG